MLIYFKNGSSLESDLDVETLYGMWKASQPSEDEPALVQGQVLCKLSWRRMYIDITQVDAKTFAEIIIDNFRDTIPPSAA